MRCSNEKISQTRQTGSSLTCKIKQHNKKLANKTQQTSNIYCLLFFKCFINISLTNAELCFGTVNDFHWGLTSSPRLQTSTKTTLNMKIIIGF